MVKPKPGDLVCARTTHDVLIKKGSCGVINGISGRSKKKMEVTWNHTTPHWGQLGYGSKEEIVSASGGPSLFLDTKRFKDTGKKRDKTFWYFPRGFMGAGLGKNKTKKVRVFEVNLK